MILYYTITAYHILKFAVHKLRFHPNEDAILLVPEFLLRKFSGFENKSIFSKCISFTWERHKNLTPEQIFEKIDEEFKSKTKGLSIKDFSEINVCRSAFYFGSWLVYNKQPFNWFEEADGRLSQPEPIMADDAKSSPERYKFAVQNGLYTGDNPCVLKKYVKIDSQLPGFYDPMAENYDVVEELTHLTSEQQKILLGFFDVPQDLSFKTNSVLMLSQHYCNMRMMTYEEHAICYQLTTDYYLDGYNLYYKVHPSDLMPYQSFMDNVEIVPAHFPAELLTLILNEPFEVGASVSSTGIYNISSICKKILTFNEEYIQSFWQNHRYYFCVKIMEQFPDYKVCSIGTNSKQLENMISFGGVITERSVDFCENINDIVKSDSPTIYFIGAQNQPSDEELKVLFDLMEPSDIIVFLNEDDSYYFYSMMRDHDFIVKELQIKADNDEEYGDLESYEHIVIFTDNEDARRKVNNMKFAKRLTQTGAELNVLSTMDKDVQILALKGMLKATEQQLEKYMDENAEITAQHQELEGRIAQQEKQIDQLANQLKKYESDNSAKSELKQEAAKLKEELELYNMQLENKKIKDEIERVKESLMPQNDEKLSSEIEEKNETEKVKESLNPQSGDGELSTETSEDE